MPEIAVKVPGLEKLLELTDSGIGAEFCGKDFRGVDARTKLIHSVATTPANVHGSQVLAELLQGEEREVWGDSAYQGCRTANSRNSNYTTTSPDFCGSDER